MLKFKLANSCDLGLTISLVEHHAADVPVRGVVRLGFQLNSDIVAIRLI